MPTTRSRGNAKGNGTSAGMTNASGGGSSNGLTPAQKRQKTIADRKAEEARRAAAAEEHTEEDTREADAGHDQLRGESVRGDSDLAKLQEEVRQLRQVLKTREDIDRRREQLDKEDAVLAERREVLAAAQRLRDTATSLRGLNADRADQTSRVTPVPRSVGTSAAEDVSITGVSRVASSLDVFDAMADQAAVVKAAADFVKSRFDFAASSVSYLSYPSPDVNSRCFEDRLTRCIQQAQQDSDPTAASLSFALGETAQAARCLIPGLIGERVSAQLHGQVSQLGIALAGIAFKMGDAADVAALSRMLVREVFRQLQTDGTDPAAFVRKRLDELRIAADMRVVKHSFAPAAAAHRAQALPGVSSSPAVQPPPGLGYGSALPPFPAMVGLSGQSKSDKFRRWIRYPRDASGFVNMAACMLCGRGSTPGSVGHRADQCNATPQQQVEWINNAIPVQ